MSKEIQDLENEIEEINKMKDWSEKVIKMKEIKEKITIQKNKINNLLNSLTESEFKKIKKRKDASIDELLVDFEDCNNVEDKAKIYMHIQCLIKESELELFDE
jgi:hypothetical protein